MRPEMGNIDVAYSWAVEQGEIEELAKMIDGLFQICTLRSWFLLGVERLQAAMDGLQRRTQSATEGAADSIADPQIIEAKLEVRLGMCYLNLGQYDLAREYLDHALQISQQIDHSREQAFCLLGLVKVKFGQTHYEFAEQSRSLYQQEENKIGLAHALYVSWHNAFNDGSVQQQTVPVTTWRRH